MKLVLEAAFEKYLSNVIGGGNRIYCPLRHIIFTG
jgi:hypothetical protein